MIIDPDIYIRHASVELIRALKGHEPWLEGSKMDPSDWQNACGAEKELNWVPPAFACTGGPHNSLIASTEHTVIVDCPKCKLLMFHAIEPVRRDYLLLLGLIDDPTTYVVDNLNRIAV